MTSACLGWEKLAVVYLSGGWYVGFSTAFHQCFQQGQLDIRASLRWLAGFVHGKASFPLHLDTIAHDDRLLKVTQGSLF